MDHKQEFWRAIDQLVRQSELHIDRPRGSSHPRYPDLIYPLDYGYLAGTVSGDGDGIDVWLGSEDAIATALICTVDLLKRDMEIKILLGCTPAEIQTIETFMNDGGLLRALTVPRPDLA